MNSLFENLNNSEKSNTHNPKSVTQIHFFVNWFDSFHCRPNVYSFDLSLNEFPAACGFKKIPGYRLCFNTNYYIKNYREKYAIVATKSQKGEKCVATMNITATKFFTITIIGHYGFSFLQI